jgi:hypothetical protein
VEGRNGVVKQIVSPIGIRLIVARFPRTKPGIASEKPEPAWIAKNRAKSTKPSVAARAWQLLTQLHS